MSYFKNFMKANRAYVDLHGTAHLPIKPKTKVAIVTCMDSRLHVAPALGLALGDAHILRNAGGRAQTFTNPEFACHLENVLGVDVKGQDFLPFTDVEESVREDMELLRKSPLIPDDVEISGGVYDVDTGRIHEVL